MNMFPRQKFLVALAGWGNHLPSTNPSNNRWPRSRMYEHRGSILICLVRFTTKRQPEYLMLLSTSGRIWTTVRSCIGIASDLTQVYPMFLRCFVRL